MDQVWDQAGKLEATVVAPGEAGEIATGMRRGDLTVGAGDRRLDVAERGVDPLERRPSCRLLAAAGHDGPVLETRFVDRRPAVQPVGDEAAGRGQMLGEELLDLLPAEAL